VGLGGEFDFGGCGLGGQEGCCQAEENLALHAANCSSTSGAKAPHSQSEAYAALKRRSSTVFHAFVWYSRHSFGIPRISFGKLRRG
jgi:hypothetical protein